jgi:hypothetical protein
MGESYPAFCVSQFFESRMAAIFQIEHSESAKQRLKGYGCDAVEFWITL